MKLSTLAVLASVSSLLVAAGCSKKEEDKAATTTVNGASSPAAGGAAKGPAPKGGSCKQEKEGLCTEFSENPLGAMEALCSGMLKGQYTKEACPRENLLGTCQAKTDATFYYIANSAGPWPADAADHCKLTHEGTFAVAPGVETIAKEKALPAANRITASCVQNDGSCEDIVGDSITMDLQKEMCASTGSWVDGKACPTDGVVASCLTKNKVTRYTASYAKKNGVPLKNLAEGCKSDGLIFAHWYPTAGAEAAAPAGKALAGKPAPAAGGSKAKH